MKYFHITLSENKDSIMKNGLIPQAGKNTKLIFNDSQGVYLFTSYENMVDGLTNWMNQIIDEDDEIIILEIDLPDNFTVYKTGSDWEAVSYRTIPPEYINIIEE